MADRPSPFRLACVQVNAGDDMPANISAAAGLARDAAADGADLIAFPECVAFMAPDGVGVRGAAAPEGSHPALGEFRALAAALGRWLLVGSLAVAPDDDDPRIANRSFLIDGAGEIRARYDKIHMFDVALDGGESYRESATYRPGSRAVVADTPFGRLGLSICYDLRFPHLYRALARNGAGMIAVPSAFTRRTGEAHWHVLLRARAIETGCFVFAPAQCGTHPRGRQTFGHSLIVDPWGRVLSDGGEAPGITVAEIDPARIDAVRAQIPSLEHDRPFDGP